jgi:predicted alpha-1,2-mannosidase
MTSLRPVLVAALLTAAAGVLPAAASAAPIADPASLVDPLIGTGNGGNVFPGADTPYGMVQFSPDTATGNRTTNANAGGYSDTATKLRGFSLTHVSGAGCAGLAGDLPFMPVLGDVTTSPSADANESVYASSFSHANETAKAGSYALTLDNGIATQLSATTRTGDARFTYPAGAAKASLLVRTSDSAVGSSAADVSIDPTTQTVSGSVTSGNFCGNKGVDGTPGRKSYYTVYFTASFDQPFAAFGTWQDTTLTAGSTSSSGGTSYAGGSYGGITAGGGYPTPGKGSGAYLQFDPAAAAGGVNMRVGISYVDAAGAAANLAAESPAGSTVDATAAQAHDAWNAELGKVAIEGGTSDQQKVFETAMYHSLLHMNVFSDVDGRYRGMDQAIHTVGAGQKAQYATFSGWDVYRSQIQLVGLIDPDVAGDMAQSLLNQADQSGGTWDRWTHASGDVSVMAGDPSTTFVDVARAFGATNWDASAALDSLVTAATVPTAADLSHVGWMNMAKGERPSLDQFLQLHYVPEPSNAWGGAGETVEDAAADFAIADLAQRLGKNAIHDTFIARAQYWQNIFDLNAVPADAPDTGYLANRNADGTWRAFDKTSGDGFAESSAAQYVWNVPFNPAGLFAAMGGDAAASKRLDAYFHNADGSWAFTGAGSLHPELNNEPSLWAPWLFDWTGEPAKTQQVTHAVNDRLWTTATSGIPGNDDLGTMSAWYVFSAIGMYPAIPGRAEMALSSPEFTKVTIHRSDGHTLTIDAPDASASNVYVQSLQLDGAAYTKPWTAESFIDGDHTLTYALGSTATTWGSAAADAPPSFRAGEQPAIGALNVQSVGIDAGGTAKAQLTVQNTTDAPLTVQLGQDGADGVTVAYTSGATGLVVPAGGKASAAVALTADPSLAVGTKRLVDLGLRTSDGGTLPAVVATVSVDVSKTLDALRNNVGTAPDATPAVGGFDASGHSYSQQALAAKGIVPGGNLAVGGFTYTWPSVATGQPDNYVADGTRIDLPQRDATRIGLLGAASNGPISTTVTVTYTDGSVSTAKVTYGDWTPGGTQPSQGDRRAATLPYRLSQSGNDTATAYLFSTNIPLDAGKTAATLTIPAPSSGRFHVFALAFDERGVQPLDALRDQWGITTYRDTGASSLDWTGHALSWGALADQGVKPGGTVAADGLSYAFPQPAAEGDPDNLEVAGQRIAVPARDGATKLGFLATAIKGPSDTVATVMYADGTSTTKALMVNDWTPATLQAGNTVAVNTLYRNTAAGNDATQADLYSIAIPLDAAKRAVWVRLTSPVASSDVNGAIHLFAIALDGSEPSGGGTGSGGGGGSAAGSGSSAASSAPSADAVATPVASTTPAAAAPAPITGAYPAGSAKPAAPKVLKAASVAGGLRLTLRGATSGRASAKLTARIGGHTVTAGRATVSLRAGRSTVVTVRLTATARRALAKAGRLRVTIAVTAGGATTTQQATLHR